MAGPEVEPRPGVEPERDARPEPTSLGELALEYDRLGVGDVVGFVEHLDLFDDEVVDTVDDGAVGRLDAYPLALPVDGSDVAEIARGADETLVRSGVVCRVEADEPHTVLGDGAFDPVDALLLVVE